METETANSRVKKQDIGRKKEIWRYVVTKRTRNTKHIKRKEGGRGRERGGERTTERQTETGGKKKKRG